MAVEVFDEPLHGQVSVDIHSYDSDRDLYTVSVGDTVGVEVPASAIMVEPPDDFDGYDDDFFDLEDYEG